MLKAVWEAFNQVCWRDGLCLLILVEAELIEKL